MRAYGIICSCVQATAKSSWAEVVSDKMMYREWGQNGNVKTRVDRMSLIDPLKKRTNSPLNTYPFSIDKVLSQTMVLLGAKQAMRNHEVWRSLGGPYEAPRTYLITSLPLFVNVTSGAVPSRPITVMRATLNDAAAEKLRVNPAEGRWRELQTPLRRGERRKDIIGDLRFLYVCHSLIESQCSFFLAPFSGISFLEKLELK